MTWSTMLQRGPDWCLTAEDVRAAAAAVKARRQAWAAKPAALPLQEAQLLLALRSETHQPPAEPSLLPSTVEYQPRRVLARVVINAVAAELGITGDQLICAPPKAIVVAYRDAAAVLAKVLTHQGNHPLSKAFRRDATFMRDVMRRNRELVEYLRAALVVGGAIADNAKLVVSFVDHQLSRPVERSRVELRACLSKETLSGAPL